MANWKKVALSGEIVNADLTGSAAISSANLADTAVTADSYTNPNITVNAKGQITAASSGAASGDANQNAYSHVAVSGQTTADADSATDTLTLVAQGGMTITTSGDTITLNSAALSLIDEDTLVSNSASRPPSQQSVKAYVDAQTHESQLSLIDEDNMATNSATRPPSQQSVKAYVDAQEHTPETADISDVSVTATELGQLETLGTTSISAGNWAALALLSGTNSGNQTVAYTSAITTAQAQAAIGYGNQKLVPSTGTSGHFLKHNGEFGLPAYTSANVPTAISWTPGTSAGPTLVTDGNNVAIPVASASASGVVTNANQTFGGTKTFAEVRVDGDLVVSGSTITSSTETLLISDNSLVLNSDLTTSTDVDAGIVVERGTTHDNALFYWDEGSDKWMIGTNNDADINTSKTYGGDVGQILIDGGATSNSVSGVPIGHLHYNAGVLSVRVAD